MYKIKETMNGFRLFFEKSRESNDENILILGRPGTGKNMLTESIIYSAWKAKRKIIFVGDPKKLNEMCYSMFQPNSKYYFDFKNKYGGRAEHLLNIKLNHPFTFDIPINRKIAKTNFYTMPIKELDNNMITFLLESEEDVNNREILTNLVNNLKDDDTLYDLIFKLYKNIQKDKKKFGGESVAKVSDDLFGLRGVKSGDTRNLSTVATLFNRFKNHYFLSAKKYKDIEKNKTLINLNMKEIIKDRETIDVFTCKYMDDEKLELLNYIYVLKEIIKYSKYARRGMLLIFDELNSYCPARAKDYKKILSRIIKIHLTRNFRARHISTISLSHSYADIYHDITKSNAFSKIFYMQIESDTDLEKLKTVYGYDFNTLKKIRSLSVGEFCIEGDSEFRLDEIPPLKINLAPFAHKDSFNVKDFDSLLLQINPAMLENYKSLVNDTQKELNAIADFYKGKEVKEYEQEITEVKDKIKEAKTVQPKLSISNLKKALSKSNKKEVLELEKNILNDFALGIDINIVAKKYNLTKEKVLYIIKKYSKVIQTGINKTKEEVEYERINAFAVLQQQPNTEAIIHEENSSQ